VWEKRKGGGIFPVQSPNEEDGSTRAVTCARFESPKWEEER
jgi:hypothetical protein